MKKIAIVTGASGGMGREFVRELANEALDEIWVTGRNEKRLLALKEEYGEVITPVCKDLTQSADLLSFTDLLEEQNPSVLWLVNNAGIARMAPSKDFSFSELEQTIDLNCKAPAALINLCIPYMGRGAKILNVSSASAFQPVPYLNLYAATKAFERSYSRALHAELKPCGITSLYPCFTEPPSRKQAYLSLQSSMPATVSTTGNPAFLPGRTILIYIINIGTPFPLT